METKPCPVCTTPEAKIWVDFTHSTVKCQRCGDFKVGDMAAIEISAWTQQQRTNLSGWLRENRVDMLAGKELERLKLLRTPAVGEKADKLLRWLARQYPKAGTQIEIFDEPISQSVTNIAGKPRKMMVAKTKPELLGRSWCEDEEEFIYVVMEYLAREKLLVEPVVGSDFRITPAGWSHIYSLSQTNAQSNDVFIAMWFDKSMDSAHLAIESGIRNAGYDPLRIDRKEHNNKIDDEIVAGIRRSKFLVADFTGQRGGVYFEAGFATGLGLPVVWLCRKDELKNIHFDTRQYNFIVWEQDKWEDLIKALQNRIEATIGRGIKK